MGALQRDKRVDTRMKQNKGENNGKTKNTEKKNTKKDDEIVFKQIPATDGGQIKDLHDAVYESMERKELYIPKTDKHFTKIFKPNYITYSYGAYVGDKLIGMASVLVGKEFTKQYAKILKIKHKQVCNLGHYLMLPEYQRRGIMTKLQNIVLDYARTAGYKYIIGTAHAENIASVSVLGKVMKPYEKIIMTKSGFKRQLFWAQI